MTTGTGETHPQGQGENWLRALKKSPRSYAEDYQDPGGVYIWRCSSCYRLFAGHRGRIVCKLCDKPPKKKFFKFFNL
jgi:rubrerythrin